MEPTLQSLLRSWSQASEADSNLNFDKWFEQESVRHGVSESALWPKPFNNVDVIPKVPTQDNPWEAMRHLRTTYPTLFERKGDGTITLWDEKEAAQQQAIEDAEAAQSQAEAQALASAPQQTQAPNFGRVPWPVVDHSMSLGRAQTKMGIATGAHRQAQMAAESYKTAGQQARLAAILRRTPKLP